MLFCLFKNNLQCFGQYMDCQGFNSCIQEKIKNLMIEYALNIKPQLVNNNIETYDDKYIFLKKK